MRFPELRASARAALSGRDAHRTLMTGLGAGQMLRAIRLLDKLNQLEQKDGFTFLRTFIRIFRSGMLRFRFRSAVLDALERRIRLRAASFQHAMRARFL
eukprot:633704-Rhodomonas_salina.3